MIELGGLPNAGVKVFNMHGSLVSEQFCTIERHTLNISHLPSGIYFVQILSNKEISVKKMLIK